MPKSAEATDVLHLLIPQLEAVDIPVLNIKVDKTTSRTGSFRGDVWISREKIYSTNWEKEIICLIEAKPSHEIPGSKEWNDAISQGKNKSLKEELQYFVVTNTNKFWRYYRSCDLQEITIDGNSINEPLGINDLELLQTQISPSSLNAVRKITPPTRFYSKKEFQRSLWQFKNIYRNCSIDNKDSMIYTSITFVVLKFISEQESFRRTLPTSVVLWNEWRDDYMDRDIRATIEDIQKSSLYSDIGKDLKIATELDAEHCKEIHKELSHYQLVGCNFDLYGSIYESFADTKMKQEFGQYYTSRHIAAAISELILRNDLLPRDIKICDPACGTGGFLTEAYRILLRNYTASGALVAKVLSNLKKDTFYGFDIKKRNISLARINMCLAGDGHTNIQITKDSLLTLPENEYDYILTNVPYGVYKGKAGDLFKYSNKKRYESMFVEKIVRALKPNGKALVIVPDGILESPSYEGYRINLLNEARIESVISLHKYVFRPYTTEKTYAMILQKYPPTVKQKDKNNPIFMYVLENDGYQKGDKRYPIRENDIPDLLKNYLTKITSAPSVFVKISEINDGNFYNLLPEFYLNYYEGDYTEIEMEEYKTLIKKLSDKVSIIRG